MWLPLAKFRPSGPASNAHFAGWRSCRSKQVPRMGVVTESGLDQTIADDERLGESPPNRILNRFEPAPGGTV